MSGSTIKRISAAQHRALVTATPSPSQYIRRVSDVRKDRPNAPVVLFCRASHQNQRDNLPAQVSSCKVLLAGMGIEPLEVFEVVGSACGDARGVLNKSAIFAKKHRAIVVAESVSRLMRSENFNAKDKDARKAMPKKEEFEFLKLLTCGVVLATIHDPDLSPDEEAALQTMRGMREKGKLGGRPKAYPAGYKGKIERLRDEPEAISLWKAGWSLGQIAKELGRHKATIQYWVESYRMNFPQAR